MTVQTTGTSVIAGGPSVPGLLPSLAPTVHQAGMPRPRRILVADDEHLAAASIVRSLRELGYAAIGPAINGSHAIQLAFYTHPDLALLDIRMATDRDGLDAAAGLYGEMAIPVVIVSAYSDPQQVRSAGAAGVFGYVVKPVTTEQLRAAIDVAWARYSQAIAAERENADLRQRLEERRTIERAKWAMVERLGLTEDGAMDRMRAAAKEGKRPLIDEAMEVLRGAAG